METKVTFLELYAAMHYSIEILLITITTQLLIRHVCPRVVSSAKEVTVVNFMNQFIY